MEIKQMIMLVLQASILTTVFGFGLKTTLDASIRQRRKAAAARAA